jgi:hypothetical protein
MDCSFFGGACRSPFQCVDGGEGMGYNVRLEANAHAVWGPLATSKPNHGVQATANSLVSLRGDVGESPSRRTRT